jgi:phage shock protein A
MGRFLNRIRVGIGALLSPAELPSQPEVEPLVQLYDHLQRLVESRERVKNALIALDERRAAMQEQAEQLRATTIVEIGRGQESLARLAIRRRQNILSILQTLDAQREELRANATQVEVAEQQMQAAVEAIASRRELISAQKEAALLQIRIGEALTGLHEPADGSALLVIDEDMVANLQARALAIGRLIDSNMLPASPAWVPGAGDVTEESVEAELAAIKRAIVP